VKKSRSNPYSTASYLGDIFTICTAMGLPVDLAAMKAGKVTLGYTL
jgi:hypothetical protein